LLVTCKPNLDQTASIVSSPIVLAVRSDPPEGLLQAQVTYTALYVDGSGPIASAPLDWAYCTARNPLANLGPVNPECLEASGSWLVPIGVGLRVTGTLPADGCRQFGPDVPESTPGQPQGRPVDPDPTGGYYQPVRFFEETDAGPYVGIAETRLKCNLANGYGSVVAIYASRYHLNVNPEVGSLRMSLGDDAAAGTPVSGADGGAESTVPAGAHVALRVAWAACPTQDTCGDHICGPDETSKTCASDCTMPTGCTGAERYAGFDLASQSVVDRREAIAVAWFATGGTFDEDRTGRVPSDLTNSSDNAWKAPASRGLVHLWVVLRDDRGGVGWADYPVRVE
jgi:hypothetical protein